MGKSVEKGSKEVVDRRKRASRRAASPPTQGKLSSAGAKIVAAFEEAIAAMQSGEPLERHFTVRTYKVDFRPRDYGPDDVRRVRDLLGMSQVLFAGFLGVDANTVRSWEQGTRPPAQSQGGSWTRSRAIPRTGGIGSCRTRSRRKPVSRIVDDRKAQP